MGMKSKPNTTTMIPVVMSLSLATPLLSGNDPNVLDRVMNSMNVRSSIIITPNTTHHTGTEANASLGELKK